MSYTWWKMATGHAVGSAVVVVCLFMVPALAARAAEKDVGAVVRARGDVNALRAGVSTALQGGSPVLFLDRVLTGANSRAEITLVDGSDLKLGDDTDLTIDELVYDPGRSGRGVLTLAAGFFRMVSGQVNKVPGGVLTLRTPLATVGVRGTDFWGHQTADKLTLALIDHGSVVVQTTLGTVALDRPLQAVVIERGKLPSRFTLTEEQLAKAAKTVSWR